MKVSVVTPTFNEAENIAVLIRELERVLADFDYEIIVSDDNSADRTWAVAEEISRANSRVRVLRRTSNRALGWSVIDAFKIANGELLACIDADLQHDPAILPQMLDKLSCGSDLAVGSRCAPGGSFGEWGVMRKGGSWLATRLAKWFTGIKLSDPMSGYFVLRRGDFLRISHHLNGRGFKILLEIASRLPGAHISEIPYHFGKRRAGQSKLSRAIVFAYLRQLWYLRKSTVHDKS
jgi:dolichol-phosphate mannosyltransferase